MDKLQTEQSLAFVEREDGKQLEMCCARFPDESRHSLHDSYGDSDGESILNDGNSKRTAPAHMQAGLLGL